MSMASRGGEVPSDHFQTASPASPRSDSASLWRDVWRGAQATASPSAASNPTPEPSVMEAGVSFISALGEAPPRTLHSRAIVRSSPLSSSVRAMLECREFGRRYDALSVDLRPIEERLPQLDCPAGAVQFPACADSLDDLSRSVECLLQHRKRLLAPTIDRDRPRRNAFVLGAGPGGLTTAIQLALRDHRVVVCEPREMYTRNRFIGVYKEVAHLMAALGMPESMTYDFSHYRGKRGIMLADIQTFLHAVALKLGVVVYTGAVAREVSAESVRSGTIELQRSTSGGSAAQAIGMTRWRYDTVARVRSGVTIRFDTIVEATGGRSGLREILVGPENVVSLRTQARAVAARDPSLQSCFDDPADHCARFVESDFFCPRSLREPFAEALLHGDDRRIPDELPGLVSNIDASIVTKPIEKVGEVTGFAARIGDKQLAIPPDWVIVECKLSDQTVARYQIEGPLPQSFDYGGTRLSTRENVKVLNPLGLLLRLLYAIGIPFDAVDRRRLVDFYEAENSYGDASDVVSIWLGSFRSIRLGGETPRWCGRYGDRDGIEYAIVGEALQNAWYRFGVGVDDTVAAASRFAEIVELPREAGVASARRFEQVMCARSVQVLYHLYAVSRHTDQGVVGPVLTEAYMDDRYGSDLAQARLREIARQGEEMRAAAIDVRAEAADSLVDAALDHAREAACRRVLALLESLAYPPALLARATQYMQVGEPDWRARVFATLDPALSAQHRQALAPLFASIDAAAHRAAGDERRRTERLIELALGRYVWVSAWLRACALHALDPATQGARAALERAAADREPLIAETARAVLATGHAAADSGDVSPAYLTIDKVLVLEDVSLFRAIPHEVLANVAPLLTERWAESGERIFDKGALGDCLYVIASGHVRVHDGERTFAELGRRQCFGELSLLDAQPRTASVTALARTHLFRLGQADFYALMRERPELTHAVNRALCAIIRNAGGSASTRIEGAASEFHHARADERRVTA